MNNKIALLTLATGFFFLKSCDNGSNTTEKEDLKQMSKKGITDQGKEIAEFKSSMSVNK